MTKREFENATSLIGFTKKSFISIPELKKLSLENKDINFYGNASKGFIESFCLGYKDSYEVYVGMIGDKIDIISTALHELGHCRKGIISLLPSEQAAWKFAKEYSVEKNYPFSDSLMNSILVCLEIDYDYLTKDFHNIFSSLKKNLELPLVPKENIVKYKRWLKKYEKEPDLVVESIISAEHFQTTISMAYNSIVKYKRTK